MSEIGTQTVWRWQVSVAVARHAYREGYDAEDRGQSTRACPYADVPGESRLKRAAWLKGFLQSQRMREPGDTA